MLTEAQTRFLKVSYIGYVAAHRAAFDRGVLAIFLVAQGLTSGQVGMLQTIMFLTAMATEFPTGLIGDHFGRRVSVTLGLVCRAIYCAGMTVASSFGHFVALFVVVGIGRSFVSGSDHALLYDALKAGKENADFLKVEARARSVGGISLSLAMAGGGILADLSWNMLFLVYLATTFVSMAIWAAVSLSAAGQAGEDLVRDDKKDAPKPTKQLLDFALRTRKGRAFSLAVLGMALMGAIVAPFYFFAQAAMADYGLDFKIIGVLYGGIEFIASLAVLASAPIERRYTFPTIGVVFCAVIAVAFFAASFGTLPWLLVGFFLVVFTSPVFDIVALHYLHRKLPSSIRASALSAGSLVLTLMIAAGYWGYGISVDLLGNAGTFAAAGAVSLLVVVIIASLSKGGATLRPYIRGALDKA